MDVRARRSFFSARRSVVGAALSWPVVLPALAVQAGCGSSSNASGGSAGSGWDASGDATLDAATGGDDAAWINTQLDGGSHDAAPGDAGRHCEGDGGPGTFTCTSSMSVARNVPGGATLPGGKVLVGGGWNPQDGVLTSAEIYDPASGTFTPTGSMSTGHLWAGWGTPWPLAAGKALVAGGLNAQGQLTATAELYDPATGMFASTGALSFPAISMSPVALDDGTVLFIGGWNSVSSQTLAELPGWSYLGSGTAFVERYSPEAGTFAQTGNLAETRLFGCDLRIDGGALAIGGARGPGIVESNIERYAVEAGTWASVGSLAPPAMFCARAFGLPEGGVLLTGTGGLSSTTTAIPGMLRFDSSYTTMATTNAIANFSPNLVQLANGDVLAFGGTLSGAPTAVAQLYSGTTNTWSTVGSMTQPRSGAVGAYLLSSGDVLVVGGADESGVPLATAEIYHH
jgi:hypothetical protein